MISAIAARKAAAAAALAAQPARAVSPEPVNRKPAVLRTPPQPTPTSPPRKRKQPDSTRPAHKRQKGGPSSAPATQPYVPIATPSAPVVVATVPPLVVRPKRAFSPSRPLSDSSDDEEQAEVVAQERPAVADVQTVDKLSTYRPVLAQNVFELDSGELPELHLRGRSCLAILRAGEKFSFVGTVLLAVVQGSAMLDGVVLRPSREPHRIFAPSSHPISAITALNSLLKPCIPLPTHLAKHVQERDVILVLTELQTGVEGLCDVCQTFEDVFAPEADVCSPLPIPGLFLVDRPARRIQPFALPRSWELALEAIEPPSIRKDDTSVHNPLVLMVKGAKRSGKSTFARTALNRLVTRYRRVAFLECDVGQSEFTPAGMISLNVLDRPQFGPAFTHLSTPYVAHFTGSTSPRSSPSHYLACVSACVQTYLMELQYGLMDQDDASEGDDRLSDAIPLVINTHGWNKGLGADLTRKVQDLLPVTDIFDFDSEQDEAYASQEQLASQSQSHAARIHRISPVISSLANLYTAADFRALNIISYLHLRPSSSTWDTSLPLCAIPPWEVLYKDAIDAIVLGCPGGEDVPAEELHTALNGGIVALVAAEPGALEYPIDNAVDDDGVPYTAGISFPAPTLSRCVGLALVRYAAAGVPHLHILTPVEPSLLAQCRVLVKGELELPIWAWLDYRVENGRLEGFGKDNIPYLQWGRGEGQGAGRRKVRRNLMRWGQT